MHRNALQRQRVLWGGGGGGQCVPGACKATAPGQDLGILARGAQKTGFQGTRGWWPPRG